MDVLCFSEWNWVMGFWGRVRHEGRSGGGALTSLPSLGKLGRFSGERSEAKAGRGESPALI